MQIARNKKSGATFEKLIEWRAGLCGLLAVKNPLSFKYLAQGKILPIRADLDFKLIRRDGRICYCDAKSFEGDSFTYSQIDRHQLQRARIYETYNVPSGFVVWLKGLGQVAYYSATVLTARGPKSRFALSDGVPLGAHMAFDLRPVFGSTVEPL